MTANFFLKALKEQCNTDSNKNGIYTTIDNHKVESDIILCILYTVE